MITDLTRLHHLVEHLIAWLRTDLAALERAEPDMPVEDRAACRGGAALTGGSGKTGGYPGP